MSLESWKTFFEIGGVVLLFLTFAFGAGALYTATKLNERQAEQLRQFEKDLTDAKTELAKQQERAATVELDLTNAKAKLESERLKRLQLQRSVQQRIIPQTGVGDKRNYDVLKPFKGVKVIFRYSPEREPGNFCGSLSAIALNAGWNVLGNYPANKNEIPDGVIVEAYVGPNGQTDSSTEAAKALAAFLQEYHIAMVRFVPAKQGHLEPNTVEVLIGQIPDQPDSN